jgi:hypothetical protein
VIRLQKPLVVFAAAVAPFMPSHGGVRHRLHLPPPPLPSSLAVDEQEWSIIPSQTVVAAGTVHFEVYDRGQDAHDLVIQGANGDVRGITHLTSGGSAAIVANLKPGTYLLYCSMFMGTPQSHYAKGMHTLLRVR